MSGRRIAVWLAASLMLLGVTVAVALYWASRSDAVLRWGVERLAARLPCRLAVEGLRGSITAPVQVGRIVCENAQFRFEANQVTLAWSPWMLRQEQLEISRLQVQSVAFTLLAAAGDVPGLPPDMGLPIAVNVDALEIGDATFSSGEKVLTLRNLSASYQGDKQAHRVSIGNLSSQWGSLAGQLIIGAQAPLPLSGTLRVVSQYVDDWPVQATLAISGTVADLQAKVDGTVGPATVTAELALSPLADDPLRSLMVRSPNLDLAVFDTRLPHTAIALQVEAAGKGREALAGRLRATNADPGSLDRARLPLRQLDAGFSANARALQLHDAMLDLGEAGGASGSASIEPGRIAASLQVHALDLRALRGHLRSTRMTGHLEVESLADRHRIVADLREKNLRVEARAEVVQNRVRVEHLLARSGGAQLTASGSLDLKDGMAWTTRGRLRGFDPAAFGDFPAARINGTVNASGILHPQWRADLQYALSSSRFRGQALEGSGKLSLSASRVRDADAQISLAGNRIRVRGGFGEVGDSLSFDLDAPRLAALGLAAFGPTVSRSTGSVGGAGIEGRVRANGTVAGTLVRPEINVDAEAAALRYEGLRIERWTAHARLEQADDPRLELRMRIAGAQHGELVLNEIGVDANGTLGAHVLNITAVSKPVRVAARLDGGWNRTNKIWAGELARLEGEGDYAFRMTAPSRLELAQGRVMLGAASVHFEQTMITLAETRYRDGELVAVGSITGVRAARVLALTGSPAGVQTSLVMGGRWSLKVGKAFDGLVELARESGDVVIVADEALPLGLSDARVELRAEANRLTGRFILAGTGLSARGEARSVLERRGAAWGVSGTAPLEVEARATLQSIRAFAALASRTVTADGSIALELRGSGTIAEPKLQGSITGDRILVENVERGVLLRDGTLRAKFSDDVVTVDQFTIKGGAGSFGASGRLAARSGAPRIDLEWTAQQLAVVQHPDLRLTVSGAGKFGVDDARIALTGKLSADQGRVELRSHTAPVLGADVVVAGREQRAPLTQRALNSELDLMLDLGPDFLVTGRGADLRLTGRVRLSSTPGSVLQAQGDINVARGTYLAYGQTLVIDKGVLRFAGPVDNPAMELRAMRRNQEVAAGVEVTGTARNPLVRLISEPEVSDAEKLSWLVLGRRVESGATGDSQALQASAVAMAAGLGTMPLQHQLARAVGLDEISYMPSADGTEGGVVAVGKRISDKVYVSHHHSVSTASNTLRITYQLSRFWSLRAESGDTDAVDLFFTISFD
ncbi:MAG TPA: translocation/assembly module TamB domain-containing protein [Burkholderiales bacterium]|nr:translocation/assembly module TamB domain-containing protein [Burkholderiales bacterium]